MLEKSVGEKFSGEVLGRGRAEACFIELVERSVGEVVAEKWWANVAERCCGEVLEKRQRVL